jgi:hypothetical protein
LSGGGFRNPVQITAPIGSSLLGVEMFVKDERSIGSTLSIGGYVYIDDKTKVKTYFEESSYTVVDN